MDQSKRGPSAPPALTLDRADNERIDAELAVARAEIERQVADGAEDRGYR